MSIKKIYLVLDDTGIGQGNFLCCDPEEHIPHMVSAVTTLEKAINVLNAVDGRRYDASCVIGDLKLTGGRCFYGDVRKTWLNNCREEYGWKRHRIQVVELA